MKKLIPLLFISLSLLLIGCNQAPTENTTQTVTWEEAIEILNSGDVAHVFQAHSLDVTLVLENGNTIETKEPAIDLIFKEVEKCGAVCADIPLATE